MKNIRDHLRIESTYPHIANYNSSDLSTFQCFCDRALFMLSFPVSVVEKGDNTARIGYLINNSRSGDGQPRLETRELTLIGGSPVLIRLKKGEAERILRGF